MVMKKTYLHTIYLEKKVTQLSALSVVFRLPNEPSNSRRILCIARYAGSLYPAIICGARKWEM
jgi:hypothetical protein